MSLLYRKNSDEACFTQYYLNNISRYLNIILRVRIKFPTKNYNFFEKKKNEKIKFGNISINLSFDLIK